MITFAYQRIEAGLSMPGLFEVNRRVPVGLAIEEIIENVGVKTLGESCATFHEHRRDETPTRIETALRQAQ
nr:hypothetical protein [Spirulina subsalsa]